mmetsp:Transcript_35262/g.89054  ORF Transcript_35262/g.89054 Transcript_35262/m.89054 type:complete len:287 (-) Transcript_35262:30-890(-)
MARRGRGTQHPAGTRSGAWTPRLLIGRVGSLRGGTFGLRPELKSRGAVPASLCCALPRRVAHEDVEAVCTQASPGLLSPRLRRLVQGVRPSRDAVTLGTLHEPQAAARSLRPADAGAQADTALHFPPPPPFGAGGLAPFMVGVWWTPRLRVGGVGDATPVCPTTPSCCWRSSTEPGQVPSARAQVRTRNRHFESCTSTLLFESSCASLGKNQDGGASACGGGSCSRADCWGVSLLLGVVISFVGHSFIACQAVVGGQPQTRFSSFYMLLAQHGGCVRESVALRLFR